MAYAKVREIPPHILLKSLLVPGGLYQSTTHDIHLLENNVLMFLFGIISLFSSHTLPYSLCQTTRGSSNHTAPHSSQLFSCRADSHQPTSDIHLLEIIF